MTWIKRVVAVAGVVVAGIAVVVIGQFLLDAHLDLPKYSMEMPDDSAHPGFPRTIVHFNSAVYVNEFEDFRIELANRVPTHAIGRTSFGSPFIYSIPGQEPTEYVAVDWGAEDGTRAVCRNAKRPPFDWRHARFQTLEFAGTMLHADHKRSTDSTLIADVVRTLRDVAPVFLPLPGPPNPTVDTVAAKEPNLARVNLYSDELPGLMFSPTVYRDSAGLLYFDAGFGIENGSFSEQWIPAGDSFTQWLKTP